MSESPLAVPAGLTTGAAGFTDDVLALLVIVALGLLWALELRRPFIRPGLRVLKQSYRTNLTTFFFNDFTLSLLSIPTLYLVAQPLSGWGILGPMADGPAKYLLTFLLLDLVLYAWHWATHHSDLLWLFHRVHHSDRVLNVTTGLRFHLGELFLETLVRVAFIAVVGVSAELVLVSQTVITIFVLFHHTNISFPGEQWVARIFIVPSLHRLHHSEVRSEHDSNYGAVFSLWDRLFGTLKQQEPQAIGLADVGEQDFADLLRYGLPRPLRAASPADWGRALREAIRNASYL